MCEEAMAVDVPANPYAYIKLSPISKLQHVCSADAFTLGYCIGLLGRLVESELEQLNSSIPHGTSIHPAPTTD